MTTLTSSAPPFIPSYIANPNPRASSPLIAGDNSSSLAAPLTTPQQTSSSPTPSGPIICPGHSRPVPDIHFTNVTPDGYFLFSACLDNNAMIRDGNTGDWIGTFIGHKGAVWEIASNITASFAATGSADFTAKIWNACNGDELLSLPHAHVVRCVDFSRDDRTSYCFTGGFEKKIRQFDLETQKTINQFGGHTTNIQSIYAFRNSPDLIVSTGSSEKSIRLWDLRSGQVVNEIESRGEITGSHRSNDESILSFVTSTKELIFVRTSDFSVVQKLTLPMAADCVAFDPETYRFVTGSDSELWVRCYAFQDKDFTSTFEEKSVNKGHHGPVRSVAFAPVGDKFASGGVDGTIRIWQW